MRNPIGLLLALLLTWLTAVPALAAREDGTRKKPYPGGRHYIWRFTLRDKQGTPHSLAHPTRWLSAKAVERRQRQRLELDSTDLPVSPRYTKLLQTASTQVVGTSRWNNTVLVRSRDTLALARLAEQPFVEKAELVWTSPDSIERGPVKLRYHEHFNEWDTLRGSRYGNGTLQIETLNGHRLHNIGLRGQGMTIAVMDGGFANANQIPCLQRARLLGSHDFVYPPSPSVFWETDHGTKVLSTMAANEPYILTGTAPEASYWLLRCEDQQSEQPVEEDYWAMAAEFADSAGVDIINSSLGYNEFDNHRQDHRLSDLDGQSTYISRTASMLARKGIVLVNSAGNTGMGPWKKLCPPADAHDIITVGALTSDRRNAAFSSVGPTQDGRVKPDVMAMGSPAAIISGRGTLVRDVGTSFSAPIVCGLVACLWQAMREKTATEIIELVRATADNHDTPNNVYGYGTPNFWRAYMLGKASAASHEPAR